MSVQLYIRTPSYKANGNSPKTLKCRNPFPRNWLIFELVDRKYILSLLCTHTKQTSFDLVKSKMSTFRMIS